MLTQQYQRHHYMYSELRGPQTVPRCASSTRLSAPAGADATFGEPLRKLPPKGAPSEESPIKVLPEHMAAMASTCAVRMHSDSSPREAPEQEANRVPAVSTTSMARLTRLRPRARSMAQSSRVREVPTAQGRATVILGLGISGRASPGTPQGVDPHGSPSSELKAADMQRQLQDESDNRVDTADTEVHRLQRSESQSSALWRIVPLMGRHNHSRAASANIAGIIRRRALQPAQRSNTQPSQKCQVRAMRLVPLGINVEFVNGRNSISIARSHSMAGAVRSRAC